MNKSKCTGCIHKPVCVFVYRGEDRPDCSFFKGSVPAKKEKS